jgi:hypothetical protein
MTRELAHDRVISALAARQHGVVARWQLLAAGLPVHVIDTRLCVGRLLALHRGVDLAATVRGRRLEQVIRRASRLRRFDLCEQQAVVARLPRHRGAPELAQLLVGLAGRGTTEMRSRLEVGFAQLCDDHGLARPVVNGQVLGERVDFHWPGTTLVVETDGFEFHATPTTFADDRRRDQKLTLAGFTVVRLTWDQVMHETGSTAAIVARLLLQCRAR